MIGIGYSERLASLIAGLAVLALFGGLGSARAGDSISLPDENFTIMNRNGTQTLGSSHYHTERTAGALILHGINRYNDGGYDVETDHLVTNPGDGPPLQTEFDHTFYTASGSVMMRGYANLETGAGVCIRHLGAQDQDLIEQMSFPNNTYAGAAILIAIQWFLRRGDIEKLHLHAFTCTPRPKIAAVTASIEANLPHSLQFDSRLMQVDVHPDFGYFTFLVKPFLPKIDAWFDPNEGWALGGAELARYYGGEQIMLVPAQSQNGETKAAQK